MPIEFPCPQCGQKLRVQDDAAGRNAKCPACAGTAPVPIGMYGGSSPMAHQPTASPYPSAGTGYGPAGGYPGPVNPYASPAYAPDHAPIASGRVGNQVVGFGDIWNHAWTVWQNNLGLLVGVVLVVAVINFGLRFATQAVQISMIQNGQRDAALLVGIVMALGGQVFQIFVSIGQMQIALKLARQQRAEFGDLFGGGALLGAVIGFFILAWIALMLGFLLLIIPGIILLVMYWPSYYLVVDNKAGVLESFGVAGTVTENNHGTTLLVWLTSFGILLLGVLACGIGVLFAAPLVSMLWATAYLMMSGQVPLQRQMYGSPYQQPGGPMAQQPFPQAGHPHFPSGPR